MSTKWRAQKSTSKSIISNQKHVLKLCHKHRHTGADNEASSKANKVNQLYKPKLSNREISTSNE